MIILFYLLVGSNDSFASGASCTLGAHHVTNNSNVTRLPIGSCWSWQDESSSSSSKSCPSSAGGGGGPCRRSSRLTAVEHASSALSSGSGFFLSRKRTAYTDDQLRYLVDVFKTKPYIDADERSRVASILGLTDKQVGARCSGQGRAKKNCRCF